jgi:hypothetical protein
VVERQAVERVTLGHRPNVGRDRAPSRKA